MLSGAPAETCSAARLIVPLWSAAASPCWAAENGAPRVHPVAAHAPCSSPVAAHALLLLPCTAQFLLLELADGNYAMMLPLISQNTFRGTLRPPRQAPAAADAACCDCGTLGCMPSKAGRRSTWRAVGLQGAVTYKQKSAAALSCAIVGQQVLWLLLGLLGCLLWRDACSTCSCCLSAALSHSKPPFERHQPPERAWGVTSAGPCLSG